MSYRFGHMLGIEPLSAEEIAFLLDQSKPFQEIQRHPLKKLATLRGKTVALAFFEPSTRTRISFATAASREPKRLRIAVSLKPAIPGVKPSPEATAVIEEITGLRLLEKSGGKSGLYRAK